MIKERYCSYEVARLLKEKGFPQDYDLYHSMVYNEEDYEDEYEVQRMVTQTRLVKAGTLSSYPAGVSGPKCFCPTHQMACDWMIEAHHICITIYPDKEKGFEAVLYNTEFNVEITLQSFGIYGYHIFENSYGKAVETALKYVLENLI